MATRRSEWPGVPVAQLSPSTGSECLHSASIVSAGPTRPAEHRSTAKNTRSDGAAGTSLCWLGHSAFHTESS